MLYKRLVNVPCDCCNTSERAQIRVGNQYVYVCECAKSQVVDGVNGALIRYGSILDIAKYNTWKSKRPNQNSLDMLKARYPHTYSLTCPFDGTLVEMKPTFEDWSDHGPTYDGHLGSCDRCDTDFQMNVEAEKSPEYEKLLEAWKKEEPQLNWIPINQPKKD